MISQPSRPLAWAAAAICALAESVRPASAASSVTCLVQAWVASSSWLEKRLPNSLSLLCTSA
ncbi:hypothetical protein D3C78_1045160 [compost metagenome]